MNIKEMKKAVLFFTLITAGVVSAETISLYSIGNSLTGPMRNENYFPKLMEMMSYDYHYGFHWRGGAGLRYMWIHPDDTSSDDLSFGKYRDVLTNENQFDFVLLEPFADDLETDKTFTQNFIDLVGAQNTNATILIYAHWPRKIYMQGNPAACLDFDPLWLWESGPIVHDGVSYSYYPEESKQHFDQLVQYLRAQNPGRRILLFPAAHAFYEFNQLAKGGQIDGFSNVYELFQDNIHPNPIGSYIVACTLYSSVTKKSPIGLPYSGFFETSIQKDRLALTIQKLVLQVQQEHSNPTGFPSANSENVGVILLPVADAFVQSGGYANKNFGTNDVLQCKTDPGNPHYTRHAYLRFDLSSLSRPVVSAKLRLQLEDITGSGLNTHAAHFVNDDSWSESTLNWNNKPAPATPLASSVQPSVGWLELDVSEQVEIEQVGDSLFSLAVVSDGDVLVEYGSREAARGKRPELFVEIISSYREWANQYQLIQGPDGDDDLDGISNIDEYAFGGNPTNELATGTVPQHGFAELGGTNWFTYVHPQRTATDSGLRYTVESSDNLVSNVWKKVEMVDVVDNGLAPGVDVVTNRFPMIGKPQQF